MPKGAGNVGSNADVSYRERPRDRYTSSTPTSSSAPRSTTRTVELSLLSRLDRRGPPVHDPSDTRASRFTRPFSPFSSDGSTAALYHLDEGAGDAIGDASGGGSGGLRRVGGDPAGPEWSSETAPLDSARRVALEEVISGAGRTVSIANAGDDRLFVVDANGRILAYQVSEEGPVQSSGTYLDIQDRVLCCGERGLLGLAFHPSFATNRYFFVYYTREPDGDIVIARYRAPTAASNLRGPEHRADPADDRSLDVRQPQRRRASRSAPTATCTCRSATAAAGAIRSEAARSSPPTSASSCVWRSTCPTAGRGRPTTRSRRTTRSRPPSGSQKKEIWAWGLRNPWRISFDRLTGDLFIADVGQDSREEVNLQLAGSAGGVNYGWPRMEGIACFNPGSGCQTGSLTLPILDYSHGEGCSITGGYRYRGQGIPTLHGVYVFGDFCSKRDLGGASSPGAAAGAARRS